MPKEVKNKEKQATPDYIGHRQRLKSRFLADLGKTMPDYELLELILAMAIPRRDTKPLAKQLLKQYMSLANVLVAPPEELAEIKGIGENATTMCALIHACAKRICWENMYAHDVPVMTDKQRVVEYCRAAIGYAGQERLMVIYLDIRGRYLRDSIEQTGTIGQVLINPRDIVEKALLYKASRIIIAHNHPSGSCAPSKADIEMTKSLKGALKTLNMVLEDHIVVSPQEYYSFKETLPFMSIP